jgi:hypothetical protein
VIKDLLERFIESIVTPRQSARRFLASGPHRLDTIAALVLGAYLVQALAQIAIPGARPGLEGPLIAWHLAGLTFQAIVYLGSTALVFLVGRLFGGEGRFEDCLSAMAWYGFITSFLTPVALIGWVLAMSGDGGAISSLLFLGAGVLGIWIFSGFVAEIHGFRSSGAVLAVIFGAVTLTSMLLFALMPPA